MELNHAGPHTVVVEKARLEPSMARVRGHVAWCRGQLHVRLYNATIPLHDQSHVT